MVCDISNHYQQVVTIKLVYILSMYKSGVYIHFEEKSCTKQYMCTKHFCCVLYITTKVSYVMLHYMV